ncbi:MAG TPA: TonB-dependent receptor, partial [Xanthomonadales bacterium]|nr:TonB-dependent receptor [Xanthomonadales bacterium]
IGEEDIGDPVLTDFNVKTHTQLNDTNELEFLLLFNPEEYSRDVENVLASDDLQDRELIDTEQDAWLFGTTWRNQLGDNMTWENRFYYRVLDKVGSEGEAFPFTDPEILPPEQVEVRESILTITEKDNEIGWRSDLIVDNSLGRFTTGIRVANLDLEYSTVLDGDWIRYEYETADSRPDESQNYIVLTPEQSNSFYEESELYYAAYAEQTFEFDRWSVSTGLRYDFDGFNDEGYTSPRIAADFRLAPNTRLSATAGLFYQAPRVTDRAANVSNAYLGWEELAHFSVGIEHILSSRWTVIAEAYYRQLDDLIIETDAVTGAAANSGDGESYGLDVVLNGSFGRGWRTNLAYSYNDTELNDNDGAGDYPSDNNYEHLLSLGVSWEINDRWQVGARWKYASGRPFDDFVIYDDVLSDLGGPTRYSREFTTNNTVRGSSFNTLDIRVDYRVPLGSFDFVAFLDLLNATGSVTTDELEFDPASGILYEEDGEVFPFIGLILEKSW